MKKKSITLKTHKKRKLKEKIILVIELLIPFMLGKKYFLHHHNSERYLDDFT